MTRIKICGLTREEDIAAVNRCLPDYIGLVFAESRRRVSPEQARRLRAGLDVRIKAVGVFTNAPVPFIVELCEQGIIDVVQLHGDESEAFIHSLKQEIDCPVIKAVRVQTREQILQAHELASDMLLLDTYQPGQYGGSGKTFDWKLIPVLQKRFFLAGGLEASNIEQALRECHPFGIDISSGVETDGVKDEAKIRQIMAIIRSFDTKEGNKKL